MAVLKAPPLPPLLLKLFKFAPFLTRRLVVAYLGRRPPKWQPLFEEAAAGALDAAGESAPGLVKRIGSLPRRFIADVMFLRHAPLSALKRLPMRVFGLEHVEQAASQPGPGIVFACSNLGCFYLNFLRPPPGVTEILVITPTVPPEEDRNLCRRIEEITGVKLILAEASTRSAIAISRQLRKGGVVATMLDSHITGTPFLLAPFLGRMASTPRGLYEILARTDARIIPVYGLRTSSGYDVFYQRAIHTQGSTPVELATEVNARLERIIRGNPDQWSLWPAVPQRWNTAQQAVQEQIQAELSDPSLSPASLEAEAS